MLFASGGTIEYAYGCIALSRAALKPLGDSDPEQDKYQADRDKEEEEQLGDASRRPRDAAKAQGARHQRDNGKNYGPFQHVAPFRVRNNNARLFVQFPSAAKGDQLSP
jgi:hypothetical protein